MDILVQQVASGCFWDSKQWVPEIHSARRFSSSAEAIEFCIKLRWRGVRLVLRFDDAQDDIYLKPFRDRSLPPLDTPSYDADAKMAELAALKEDLLAQETRMQSDIDDITRRLDSMHRRLQFAAKAARLRNDATDTGL